MIDNKLLDIDEKDSSNIPREFPEIDFNKLLSEYGPDGLFELADKLKQIAMDDMRMALDIPTEDIQMSEQEGFKVVVTGFKTQAEADAFIGWYEGQGEQDACIWLECRKQEGKIETDFMPVDIKKYHEVSKWDGNQRELPLRMTY